MAEQRAAGSNGMAIISTRMPSLQERYIIIKTTPSNQ
jgi:hypothetical protein